MLIMKETIMIKGESMGNMVRVEEESREGYGKSVE